MDMKYILYSKVHTTKEAGDSWTFKFQPIEPIVKKWISFNVTTTDPQQDMGQLDLPQSIGDTIVLKTGVKESQVLLIKGNKKAAD